MFFAKHLFEKKNAPPKENLKEAPLEYWEEKSYMMVIPENEDDLANLNDIIGRISDIPGITVMKKWADNKSQVFRMNIKYDNEEYQIGLFPGRFSLPRILINSSSYSFTEEEIEKLENAKSALTIYMEFKSDAKKSFHLQLKLAVAAFPNFIGLVDESAEQLLPAKWAVLAANSSVTPGPGAMYIIHAVYNESGEIWLHTHGLCRCGLTELEILQSDKENYGNHCNLINAFASFLIDKDGEFNPRAKIAYLGALFNGEPVVAICKSWTEAIHYYDRLETGGIADRKEAHNTRTSPIFLYKTEEDMKNNNLSKVADYNDLWGENPIFFFSDKETARMRALAIERFDYLKKALQDKGNKALIKIGLTTDGGEDCEHIWFELLEFNHDKFKAKLTQEPYRVSNAHKGDERWFTVEEVTDWIIYTPKFTVTPDKVYLL